MAIFYLGQDALNQIEKPVVTIGTFDGVHLGHRTILKEVINKAKEIGRESMVLTFDPHPRSIIQPNAPTKIITPLEQKLQLILNAGIDHIVVAPFSRAFSQLSAEEYVTKFLVKEFHPAAVVIGYDHRFGHDRKGDIELLKAQGRAFNFVVDEIPAHMISDAAISSTKIREALTHGDIATANQMLDRPYSLSGIVVKGEQLGRKLGYPTANLHPHSSLQLIPAIGIYAAQVRVGSRLYNSAMSIGVRPTVAEHGALSIEAHLLDFSDDLYGMDIELLFHAYIRAEEKFNSLDALKAAIATDEQITRSMLKNID
ncbi:MAG: bifunctional riboflavin kinase/FAD synthetase [Bacteroidetes bacterium]|nr:bifunctional riboflavin kinase/FAD synthetase [Bacteroidota bacterium]